jgi:hypothetical protein
LAPQRVARVVCSLAALTCLDLVQRRVARAQVNLLLVWGRKGCLLVGLTPRGLARVLARPLGYMVLQALAPVA